MKVEFEVGQVSAKRPKSRSGSRLWVNLFTLGVIFHVSGFHFVLKFIPTDIFSIFGVDVGKP